MKGVVGRLLVVLSAWAVVCAHAAYPERPIQLVVPYAAGGPMDKLARQLGAQMQTVLGQTVLILNRGGAGGNVGAALAKRGAPDGYTLLLDHVHMATAPTLYRKLDFDPVSDFEPLGIVAESPLVLVTRPEVETDSLDDMLRWMARQPQVTLANAGVGSASHLCGLLLQSTLKLQMTTVSYRGTGPAMLDLLGGQVDLMCDLTANALPQLQAHKVKAVAVTVEQALNGTPLEAVPSMAAYGIAQAPLTIWYGLYAPRDTPHEITRAVSAALAIVATSPVSRQQLVEVGMQAVTDERLSATGHRQFLAKEIRRWAPIIKAAGVYAD